VKYFDFDGSMYAGLNIFPAISIWEKRRGGRQTSCHTVCCRTGDLAPIWQTAFGSVGTWCGCVRGSGRDTRRRRESHGNLSGDGSVETTDGLALVPASGTDFPSDLKQISVAQWPVRREQQSDPSGHHCWEFRLFRAATPFASFFWTAAWPAQLSSRLWALCSMQSKQEQ